MKQTNRNSCPQFSKRYGSLHGSFRRVNLLLDSGEGMHPIAVERVALHLGISLEAALPPAEISLQPSEVVALQLDQKVLAWA